MTSLLVSLRLPRTTTLIIGGGSLAVRRTLAILECGGDVVVLGRVVSDELRRRDDITVVDTDETTFFETLGKLLDRYRFRVACIADPSSIEEAGRIYSLCQTKGVLVNTSDMPDLCDFTFLSTTTTTPPLQIGVTTNGQGCRLASRIKRDIVARLPKETTRAVNQVGILRSLAADSTQMQYVAQVSEYWPLDRLASMSRDEMASILNGSTVTLPLSSSLHFPTAGRIILAGSGPGHPGLLTTATLTALQTSSLVLTDKLVPQAILDCIPKSTPIQIARKFPGNADKAQDELMHAALTAAKSGGVVLRLKQGDPSVYGRLGEEILFFRKAGFEPTVIPGVSSALAGPLCAGISVTQRGAAESVVFCTGVGRGGKEGRIPSYERARTLCLLMANGRLAAIVETLLEMGYPSTIPMALIERASMVDQRAVYSRLNDMPGVMEALEQRPPGMLLIGWAASALWDEGDITVLDDDPTTDDARVTKWLGGQRYRVVEGLPSGWADL